ncbi:MAG: hypothetical protein KIT84_27470 [Labilithrix sp.]|nr:hypothetical protein [Labilithrix sp.]MCW5814798.1 hypothetical protein [Labilithrix sp.]
MDPWSPIAGISLERYAELSAEVTGETDPAKQAEIVGKLGVSAADWQAATSGWTARMQDPSLMGQVATRYMPLYQAALAKKSGGAPQVTFDDYVAMSGCVPVMGRAGMLAHYKLTEAQWTMIAGHWNSVIPTNPAYMQYGVLVEQEAARLRAGGQPKPLGGGGAAAAPAPAPVAPAPAAAPNPYGYPQQPNPYAQQQPYYNNPNYQAQQAGAAVGNAFNSFGNALGSFFDSAIGAFNPGSRVIVTWSDGGRYPATVTQAPRNGQVEVGFPDGRRVWVPQHAVMANY